ncbi:MAG TPA: D-2-hydroxyacid dehydrogenase [Thermomicrobiales bacterium]|nr:D-2-hydroxyacid dehydrogenase [Thermomicrobiales bacterium]
MPDVSKIVVAMGDENGLADGLRAAHPNLTIVGAGDKDDILREIVDADGVICWRIPNESLDVAERLKWVHVAAAGVEALLAMPGFREKDLLLTNSSGVSAPNMAEHAIAMILAFGRRFPALIRSQGRHAWREWDSFGGAFEIGGQTVALIGLGAIGSETAKRAKALGMHVVGVKRTAAGELPNVDEIHAIDDIDTALAQADHVVSSLPSTSETRGLFDAGRFAAMKEGSFFYNIGRGTTVVQDELIAVLKSGHIAGAGLDVTDPEPLPAESPLWDLENVLITSHTSGNSPRVRERVLELAIENVRRFVAGEELLNIVDQSLGY